MNNYKLVKNTEWKDVEINGEDKEIPVGWNVCSVEESIEMEKNIKNSQIPNSSILNNGTIPVVGQEVEFISGYTNSIKPLIATTKNPTIIFGDHSCTLKFITFNYVLGGDGTKVFKGNDKTKTNFLFYAIKNLNFNTDGYKRHFSILKEKLINIPPLSQQSTIASILSHQESIIQDIESLISKHESRFQYLSDELLSGRLRVKEVDGQTVLYKNPEDNWKEVEINGEMKEIPKDWEVFTLKDFGFVKTSSVDKKIKEGEQIVNLFNYMDVYRSTTKLVDSNIKFTKTSIKPHVLEENYIRKGDVFFTPSSETEDDIGYSATAIEDIPNAVYSYHLIRFRPTKKLLDERFSGKLFNTKLCRDYFTEKCNGLTRMTLKKGDFEELQIYFPTDLLEQNTIYSVIHNQEKMIEYQKSLWDKEKQKFNWLLDNLLSGKYLIKE